MAEQVRLRGGQITWTDEQDALLKKHWAAGLSCSQTALALIADGCPPRTRNAIIGRVHRLGLPRRGFSNASNRIYQSKRKHIGTERSKAQRTAASRKSKKAFFANQFGRVAGEGPRAGMGYEAQQKAFARAIARQNPVDPLHTTLSDLEWGMCRAVSDTSEWGRPTYCGHACGETDSFCDAHKARFFVPLKPRKRYATEDSRHDRRRYRDSARWAGL